MSPEACRALIGTAHRGPISAPYWRSTSRCRRNVDGETPAARAASSRFRIASRGRLSSALMVPSVPQQSSQRVTGWQVPRPNFRGLAGNKQTVRKALTPGCHPATVTGHGSAPTPDEGGRGTVAGRSGGGRLRVLLFLDPAEHGGPGHAQVRRDLRGRPNCAHPLLTSVHDEHSEPPAPDRPDSPSRSERPAAQHVSRRAGEVSSICQHRNPLSAQVVGSHGRSR